MQDIKKESGNNSNNYKEVTLESTLKRISNNKLSELRVQKFYYSPRPIHKFDGHMDEVDVLAVLPDGTFLAGDREGVIRHWNPKEKQWLQEFQGHEGGVASIAVLPDGTFLSANSTTILHWDINKKQWLQEFEAPKKRHSHTFENGGTDIFTGLAVLPNGTFLSTNTTTIYHWDITKKQWLDLEVFEDRENLYPRVLTVLPDGTFLFGSHRGSIYHWDLKEKQCLQEFQGHLGYVASIAVLPDGTFLSTDSRYDLRHWDLKEKQCLQKFTEHPKPVGVLAVLPDGTFLAAAGYKRSIYHMGVPLSKSPLFSENQIVEILNVLPQNLGLERLDLSEVKITDIIFKKFMGMLPKLTYLEYIDLRETLLIENQLIELIDYLKKSSYSSIREVCISENEFPTSLVTALKEALKALREKEVYKLILENIINNELSELNFKEIYYRKSLSHYYYDSLVHTFEGDMGWVHALAVLPDGTFLSGGCDKTIRHWDIMSKQCLYKFEGHTGDRVWALALLSGGTFLSGGCDKTIRHWDITSKQCLHTFEGHTSDVNVLVVLPDGTFLSGSKDTGIRHWDIKSKECLYEFKEHTSGITALTLLPDGKFLSGDNTGVIRQWSLQEKKCLHVFVVGKKNHAVISLASLSDKTFLSGDSYNIYHWDIQEKKLLLRRSCKVEEGYACSTFLVLPDATFLSGRLEAASLPYTGTILHWDTDLKECLYEFSKSTRGVQSFALLPDGSFLAGGRGSIYHMSANWPSKNLTRIFEEHILELLTALPQNVALKRLNLSEIKITEPIFKKLLEVLPALKNLEELDLRETPLTEQHLIELIQYLKNSSHLYLKQVFISENQFTSKLVNALQKALLKLIKREDHIQSRAPYPNPHQNLFSPGDLLSSSELLDLSMNKSEIITGNDSENNFIQKSSSLLLRDKEIPYKDLTIKKILGKGGFGIVHQAKWHFTKVAVKELHATHLTEKQVKEFYHEVSFLVRLRHPQIVQFYGVCTLGKYAIVMEFCKKGSLYNVLHNPQEKLPWEVRIQIAIDSGKGIYYLHKQNIIHQDIKSLNILLDKNYSAKLTDFGLSKTKTYSTSVNYISQSPVGTMAWMAPELLNKVSTSFKSDIYAYGMVLWELSSREVPYTSATGYQMLAWIMQGIHDEIPKDTPPKLAHLIKWCWQTEPKERPSAKEALESLMTLKN